MQARRKCPVCLRPWHTPDSQCSSANTAAAASRKKARTAAGYSSDCAPRAYACHIAELTAELLHAPLVQDYCCTQPCEGQNGLLAYDRTPKVPLELIWKANEAEAPERQPCSWFYMQKVSAGFQRCTLEACFLWRSNKKAHFNGHRPGTAGMAKK